jgi:hypothetical protein
MVPGELWYMLQKEGKLSIYADYLLKDPPLTESQYLFIHCMNSRLSRGLPLMSLFTSMCCDNEQRR